MYDAFGSLAFMESLIVEPSTVVSSSTLVDGQCLDYVILCDYVLLCNQWSNYLYYILYLIVWKYLKLKLC